MSSSRSCGLAFACAALLAAVVGAAQYPVGGDSSWGVPDSNAESYNSWAVKTSFQIGDTLLFVYPKDKDSVLLVQPGDYNACNTSSYDKKFSDGSTVFDLDRAGAFFFISGVDANCRANEKLIVMVAAAAKGAPAPPPSSDAAAQAPPPSAPNAPATTQAPPPSSPNAPATAQAPSPASPNVPATAQAPPSLSSPAAGAMNSRAKGTPPATVSFTNGAGITVVGLAGSIVASIGYAMLAV